MASYTVTSAKHATLAAGVVDTVTITTDISGVEILNRGADLIYFTTTGATPTVGGDNTYVVPAGGALRIDTTETIGAPSSGGNPATLSTAVKLISGSATAYSVSAF